MSTQEPETVPSAGIPTELWMLWIDEDVDWCDADDAPIGTYLVCFNEADAIEAAEYQRASRDIDARPVRVK